MHRRRALVSLAVFTCAALLHAQAPAPQPVDLLITGGTVITMDPARRVIAPGAVAIREADIVGVGSPDELRQAYTPRRVIDAGGRVIMPGLINTHGHAPMVMYRGLADDLALMDWLQQYIFPAEAKTVAPAFVRAGTALAALEMIRSGTTTYVDMYYFEEEIARVTRAAGLRGVLGQTVIGFPSPDAKTPADALARTERFLQEFADDPLITPAVAPHSMYLVDKEVLLACRALAVKHQKPLLIHLAETEDEIKTARERFQASPTAFLQQIGFWAPRTLAAHGVWVTDEDIALLAQAHVGVSHNPESNMKLASGTAPVTKYLKAGMAVGLGTDGAASNNDLDMFEAMRETAFLHKLTSNDPRAIPAATALAMATIEGARVLGMDGQIGSLEAGKRADLIVVSMAGARQTPMYDPLSHLVYVSRGSDVVTTIVNGKMLMRDRQVLTLNEAEVIAEANAMAARVRAAVAK